MRNISDATKVTKVVGKVLTLLANSDLTEEQIESVLRSTEISLGIKPPMPPNYPVTAPADDAVKEA